MLFTREEDQDAQDGVFGQQRHSQIGNQAVPFVKARVQRSWVGLDILRDNRLFILHCRLDQLGNVGKRSAHPVFLVQVPGGGAL